MKEVKKIVVASSNPAKVTRFRKILSEHVEEVVSLNDLGIVEKPEESGETAEENAKIKGRFYAKKTGLIVFSEDEALYVDFLPGSKQPGVHVRRIDGKDEVNDDTLLKYWEKLVAEVPKNERTGRWHIAYSIVTPNGKSKTVTLDSPLIFFSPSSDVRIPGWPMSSLEGPIKFNKPHSELSEEEREIHEGEANGHIVEKLRELMEEL
jgi:inosine/xanthosine triphosphate pyrophosphatase family protein